MAKETMHAVPVKYLYPNIMLGILNEQSPQTEQHTNNHNYSQQKQGPHIVR